MSEGSEGRPKRKIERVMERYGLEDLGAELERRWTHDDPDRRSSVRELEAEFNAAVVRSVFVDVGTAPPEYSAEEVYELLRADDAPAEDAAVVETWLEQHGYDAEEVANDFVSFQSVYTYLREVRDAEAPDTEASAEERRESAVENLNGLKYRAEKVSERTIASLRNAGVLPDADYEPHISFEVECPACHRRTPLVQVVRRGGCVCQIEDADAG
jgi:hypothetical protein